MALPAGRYGVTKRQLNKIKNLPVNTIGIIEELQGKYTSLKESGYQLNKDSMTLILANADLNDYKTPGSFYSAAASITNSLSNCPITGSGFNLHVESIAGSSGQYIIQTLKRGYDSASGYTPYVYKRGYNGSTWGSWFEEVTDESLKADNSVIAPVEDQATCQNPDGYAVGEHFIRNKKFCTAIASIANGATFILNTNYVEGTIADNLIKRATFSGTTTALSNIGVDSVYKNVIGISPDDHAVLGFPYKTTAGGLGFHFTTNAMVAVGEGVSVSGTYFYI